MIKALLSGEVDAVVDPRNNTPILLSIAQAALRESEERYRQIVETTTDGIIKVDRDAIIVFVNERFAELVGYDSAALIGVSLDALVGDAERLVIAESLRERTRGATDTFDTFYRHKTGRAIAVNIAGSSLHDGE